LSSRWPAARCRGGSGVIGIILGAGAAVVLRIAFTLVVQQLFDLPWLKLVGGRDPVLDRRQAAAWASEAERGERQSREPTSGKP
jgi:predicted tellurium resistance membrane protein TerC